MAISPDDIQQVSVNQIGAGLSASAQADTAELEYKWNDAPTPEISGLLDALRSQDAPVLSTPGVH